MHFVRVEIVLQDAAYFIIFTDAETMPPPLRIDNFSQVDLDFHQVSESWFPSTHCGSLNYSIHCCSDAVGQDVQGSRAFVCTVCLG